MIYTADVDESLELTLPPDEVAGQIACLKGRTVLQKLQQESFWQADLNPLIIACDTVVALDTKLYGKPKSVDDARSTLTELSGNTHQVITAVHLLTLEKEHTFAITSEVTFAPIEPHRLEFYLATGDCLDKAGSYGIQGMAHAKPDTIELDIQRDVARGPHKPPHQR